MNDSSENDIIRCMLQLYPESAKTKDGHDASLLLEKAVHGDYPPNVIQAIIDANVNAVTETISDGDGDLIIHGWFRSLSCPAYLYNVYATAVILITAYPESLLIQNNDELETPLHCLMTSFHSFSMCRTNSKVPLIVNYIIDKCPECLQLADSNGFLPLHRMTLSSCSPEGTLLQNGGFLSSVYNIVDSYPNGTHIVGRDGRLPIRTVVLLNPEPSRLGRSHQSMLRSFLDKLLQTFPGSIWEVVDAMLDHNFFNTEPFYRHFLDDHFVKYADNYLNQPIVYYERNKAELVYTKDILLLHMVCRDKRLSLEQLQFFIQHDPQLLVRYSYDIAQDDIPHNQYGNDVVRDDSYQQIQLAALTPLQLLCMNKQFLSTKKYSDMETILKSCPEAAITKTINWGTSTTNGFLPIFLACQYDAPLDIILCLLEYSLEQLFT